MTVMVCDFTYSKNIQLLSKVGWVGVKLVTRTASAVKNELGF
jgi:hypothetical protein